MILHIDMDAFFASIEQAINPKLKGRPLIIGSRNNKYHTVVCAASYEAKNLGIDSGMLTKEAFAICPYAEFVPADSSKYLYVSQAIFNMLFDYDPNPQYASVDEFQLDLRNLTTCQQKALALEIKKRIRNSFEITCSIGIAKNCLLAKLASKLNKPDGLCILNHKNLRKSLKHIPVDKLCGIGPKTNRVLSGLKIFTCLDILNASQKLLNTYLGKVGYQLFWALRAEDSFPIIPKEKETTKSIGHSYTLPKTHENPIFIKAWIRLLSEMVAARLRNKNLMAKTIHLDITFGQQKSGFTKQKTFQIPVNDGYQIYERALKIAPNFSKKGQRITALRVSCSKLEAQQPTLFKKAIKREELLKSADFINAKFGEWTIYPAILQQISPLKTYENM